MTRLETLRASQATATQRAGRAGRLEPGVCYRLWTEAEPTHDRFSIASGEHAGYDCSDCHVNLGADSADITCIGCHAHTRSRADPYHLGNGDYEWAPRACYRCHPRAGGR